LALARELALVLARVPALALVLVPALALVLVRVQARAQVGHKPLPMVLPQVVVLVWLPSLS